MSQASVGSSASVEVLLGQVADEFTERLQRGEQPRVEDYAGRYPEIADLLRQVLPALLVMGSSASHGGVGGTGAAADDRSAARLGDFRIVREVGRGGMGVVYEAEQLSLGRRVALKVLPLAGALDARQLQRFKNEAQAAAQLHHTNIVAVHYVGAERGVHFYAMQFIEGQSLAEVITDLRTDAGLDANSSAPVPEATSEQPSLLPAGASTIVLAGFTLLTQHRTGGPAYFRSIAELGVQAAEALDFAHQQGIVHRDVKPGNLLLDTQGRLYVTDFGLAQVHSDTRLTMTGDLVGTLRYMSPEQATARRAVVDHRTDIYSLGATLYELLALEPAFAGTDRQELLRQIAIEEPTSLRRRNKSIPVELETIVLKAMEKEPTARYTTAQELAEDLRHFLENRTIRARPPSLGQRCRKWLQRHPVYVNAAVVVLGVIVLATTASTLLVWRAYQSEAAQRQQADANLHRANEQKKYARQAVDDMYTQVASRWLSKSGLTKLQREFLGKTLQYYEHFAQEDSRERSAREARAEACVRVGDISRTLQESDKALRAFRTAGQLYSELVAEFPDEPQYRHNLAAKGYGEVAGLIESRDPDKAEKLYRESIRVLEPLVAEDHPKKAMYQASLSVSYMNLSLLLRQRGRAREAFALLHHIIEVLTPLTEADTPDSWQLNVLADAHNTLGAALFGATQFDAAANEFRADIRYREKLLSKKGHLGNSLTNDGVRFGLGRAYSNLGAMLLLSHHHDEAHGALSRAIDIMERLQREFPQVPGYPEQTAMGYVNRGALSLEMGKAHAAEQDFRRAIDLYEKTLKTFPNSGNVRHSLAKLLVNAPPSLHNPRRAIELSRQVIKQMPANPAPRIVLGMALYEIDAFQEARQRLQEGAQLSGGGDTELWFYLAICCARLGDRSQAQKWYDKGKVSMRDKSRSQVKDLVQLQMKATKSLHQIKAQPAPSSKPAGP